jgi:hypothetical protein
VVEVTRNWIDVGKIEDVHVKGDGDGLIGESASNNRGKQVPQGKGLARSRGNKECGRWAVQAVGLCHGCPEVLFPSPTGITTLQ